MTFSLSDLIQARQNDQYRLHHQYLNSGLAQVQKIIGFDKIYTQGEGAYLWDVEGNRYLDLLSGYSVYNLGRGHPVIKEAIEAALALERPNLVKMDCPLLAGLLAEALVEHMPPGLDAVFFANSGSDAVDTAVKFARDLSR
jgi:ornithine--oxo-acid transaminase